MLNILDRLSSDFHNAVISSRGLFKGGAYPVCLRNTKRCGCETAGNRQFMEYFRVDIMSLKIWQVSYDVKKSNNVDICQSRNNRVKLIKRIVYTMRRAFCYRFKNNFPRDKEKLWFQLQPLRCLRCLYIKNKHVLQRSLNSSVINWCNIASSRGPILPIHGVGNHFTRCEWSHSSWREMTRLLGIDFVSRSGLIAKKLEFEYYKCGLKFWYWGKRFHWGHVRTISLRYLEEWSYLWIHEQRDNCQL